MCSLLFVVVDSLLYIYLSQVNNFELIIIENIEEKKHAVLNIELAKYDFFFHLFFL